MGYWPIGLLALHTIRADLNHLQTNRLLRSVPVEDAIGLTLAPTKSQGSAGRDIPPAHAMPGAISLQPQAKLNTFSVFFAKGHEEMECAAEHVSQRIELWKNSFWPRSRVARTDDKAGYVPQEFTLNIELPHMRGGK
jgi:hypothetical protein